MEARNKINAHKAHLFCYALPYVDWIIINHGVLYYMPNHEATKGHNLRSI